MKGRGVDRPPARARHSAHYSMILRTNCIARPPPVPPRSCGNFLLRSVRRGGARHGTRWAESLLHSSNGDVLRLPSRGAGQRRRYARAGKRRCAIIAGRCLASGRPQIHHHTVAKRLEPAWKMNSRNRLYGTLTALLVGWAVASPVKAQNIQSPFGGSRPFAPPIPQGNGPTTRHDTPPASFDQLPRSAVTPTGTLTDSGHR